MTDTAMAQLLAQAQAQEPTLLVLDENAAALPRNAFANAQALSNRLDVSRQAAAQGWPCSFSDFDFASVQPGFRQALYRISKEKRVVEHVLQSLWDLLPNGGVLHFCGYKNEGVKTFAKRMQEAWHCEPTLQRGDQHLHLYQCRKADSSGTRLNEADYHALQAIGMLNADPLMSKPGIFAWDRFDNGSSFLLGQLRGWLGEGDCSQYSALDLGCGYGLLAVALLQAGCRRVVATDNNAAAVRACSANLAALGAERDTLVVAADCGDVLDERFDLILCNPPFHQGFDVEQDLTDRFLSATKRLLAPKGRALFVVNAFIPLERKAAAHFTRVHTLADDRRFRVIELQR
jgi:16S rRNA (guanine1207-N2)-methyltransferase